MTGHRQVVESQFARQAEAYSQNRVVADDRLHRFLVAATGVDRGGSVLDVACGPGFLTLAFAEAAATVVGVDATTPLLQRAAATAAEHGLPVRFARGDVVSLPFADETFDVVACKFAFHHFPDPAPVFDEMTRVTRRGGRIVVVDMIGSEDPGRRAEHDRIERLCDPSHTGALPKTVFERMFADADATILFHQEGESGEPLDEWLAHGGPGEDDMRRIREWAAAYADTDVAGCFRVARENGLRVSHTGALWVLERSGAAGGV